jgi:uncharacterized protein YbjT (DUF2867 family)
MKILVTGATGYIGRHLIDRLLMETDVNLRVFVRDPGSFSGQWHPGFEIIKGDTFNRESLKSAVTGIDVAYYLIHSMGTRSGNYADLDRRSAENFREECINAGVKRIVYLGGLGVKESTSAHLKSRIETGEILGMYPEKITTVWLRAGIIIGSVGASFEIIRNLVRKLPVMITPRWVDTRTEPIALADILEYCEQARRIPLSGTVQIDIGSGPIRFRDMLKEAARVFGLKRLIIPVPLFSPRLSSYWLILMTPVPFSIASALVEGLKYKTVKMNSAAEKFFPDIKPLSYTAALLSAISPASIQKNVIINCQGNSGKK